MQSCEAWGQLENSENQTDPIIIHEAGNWMIFTFLFSYFWTYKNLQKRYKLSRKKTVKYKIGSKHLTQHDHYLQGNHFEDDIAEFLGEDEVMLVS